jgi:hypothetical protein
MGLRVMQFPICSGKCLVNMFSVRLLTQVEQPHNAQTSRSAQQAAISLTF